MSLASRARLDAKSYALFRQYRSSGGAGRVDAGIATPQWSAHLLMFASTIDVVFSKVRLSERQQQRMLPITSAFSERLLRADRKRGAFRRIAMWKVAWQVGPVIRKLVLE